MRRAAISIGSFVALSLVTPVVHAEGFDAEVRTAATVGVTDSLGFPGQDDGTRVAWGFATRGALRLEGGDHAWATRFALDASLTPAPDGAGVAKARDGADIESDWHFHFVPWFGAAVAVGASASLLGSRIDTDGASFAIERVDGTETTHRAGALRLSDPGLPLRLKQSAGPMLVPVDRDPVRVTFVLGPGARETLADHQLAVSDDRRTRLVEIEEMATTARAGVAGSVEIRGAIEAAHLDYRVGVEFLTPFAYDTSLDDDRGMVARTDTELRASLSLRLVSWASVDYAFDALREPLVLDDFRVRSCVVVAFGPTLTTARR